MDRALKEYSKVIVVKYLEDHVFDISPVIIEGWLNDVMTPPPKVCADAVLVLENFLKNPKLAMETPRRNFPLRNKIIKRPENNT